MQIITITLDFFLFITSALIFSITILCLLLYRRVADHFLKGFLGILVPLTIQMALNSVGTYMMRISSPSIFADKAYSSFALLATFISIFCSAALLMFLSKYLTSLLPIPDKQKIFAGRIINIITMLFLFACLFAVFFINEGAWISSMNLALEDLFLSASLILSSHGIAALFYIKNAENREHENLLRGIAFTFLPLIPFYTLDMLFLKDMAFKLTYLSYSFFCVNVYLFISRHYIRNYEPAPGTLSPKPSKLSRMGFSARETEIIQLLVKGRTNKEIGEELFISVNTVKTHIKNIYSKLKISNRIQLIQKIRE